MYCICILTTKIGKTYMYATEKLVCEINLLFSFLPAPLKTSYTTHTHTHPGPLALFFLMLFSVPNIPSHMPIIQYYTIYSNNINHRRRFFALSFVAICCC